MAIHNYCSLAAQETQYTKPTTCRDSVVFFATVLSSIRRRRLYCSCHDDLSVDTISAVADTKLRCVGLVRPPYHIHCPPSQFASSPGHLSLLTRVHPWSTLVELTDLTVHTCRRSVSPSTPLRRSLRHH